MNDFSNLGGFKKFVKSASRIIDKISITSGGAVGFSTSFSHDHNLKDYVGIVLYWNDVSSEVGIRFLKDGEDEEGALKLKANNNGLGHTVNAKSFFVTSHIDTEKCNGRFEYQTKPLRDFGVESDSNLYIISLKDKLNPNEGGELET